MAWQDELDQNAMIQQYLAGPSEEDRKQAAAVGLLTSGLGILSAPRTFHRGSVFSPGQFAGAAAGIPAYQSALKEARNQRKADLADAIAAKKLTQESENAKRYADFFNADGEPDYLGLAKRASENGDMPMVKQALGMHEKKEAIRPMVVPDGSGLYDPKTHTFLEPPTPKKTNSQRKADEMIAAGVDPDMALGLAMGTVKPVTLPDGSSVYIDLRKSGPGASQVRAPATSIPSTGTPDAAMARADGPGPMPGAMTGGASAPLPSPSDQPNPASGAPRERSRFQASPLPAGAIPGTHVQGTKNTKQLDDAVQHLGTAYAKTGVEDFDRILQELKGKLTPYVDSDPVTGQMTLKKGADIPGAGLTGGFPTQMLSAAGRDIAGSMQELQNIRLYDLSGKAVTQNEAMRQARAAMTGPFQHDADVVNWLNRVQNIYQGHKANIEAQANPEVLSEYRNRQRDIMNTQTQPFTGYIDKMGYETDEGGNPTGRRFERRGSGYVRIR